MGAAAAGPPQVPEELPGAHGAPATSDPAGHVPMNKCSHSSRRPRTVSRQRRSAAQPRVDASQVNAKATASGMPPSRNAIPED